MFGVPILFYEKASISCQGGSGVAILEAQRSGGFSEPNAKIVAYYGCQWDDPLSNLEER